MLVITEIRAFVLGFIFVFIFVVDPVLNYVELQ